MNRIFVAKVSHNEYKAVLPNKQTNHKSLNRNLRNQQYDEIHFLDNGFDALVFGL